MAKFGVTKCCNVNFIQLKLGKGCGQSTMDLSFVKLGVESAHKSTSNMTIKGHPTQWLRTYHCDKMSWNSNNRGVLLVYILFSSASHVQQEHRSSKGF